MKNGKERQERSAIRLQEEQEKRQWVTPLIEELPPLTELALGSMGAKGTSTSWSFD